jgi:hypothetical protein
MISDKLTNMKAIYSILALLVIGCDDPNRCETTKQYAESFEANVVLLKEPKIKYQDFILVGVDPTTKRDTVQLLPGRWFYHVEPFCDLGDTIVKRKGVPIIEVHKTKKMFDTTRIDIELNCIDYFINGKTTKQWNEFEESYGNKLNRSYHAR